MSKSGLKLDKYDYQLPKHLLASVPVTPRDNSKLFVYDTSNDAIYFDKFKNLEKYLVPGTTLVLNDTKVLPARIVLKKDTGGKAEVLFLINEYRSGDKQVKALSDRKLTIGSFLSARGGYRFRVAWQDKNIFFLEPEFRIALLLEILKKYGATPLPKYLKGTPLKERELKQRYQSIFARKPASVAAPTASLHFTKSLLKKLAKNNIYCEYLTLNIGLGTFAPLTQKNINLGKLHREFFVISPKAWAKIGLGKRSNRPTIAVGTTVVRALESRARNLRGKTDLFIRSPFDFKIIDGLITNFHLPKSSLMCLVDAFLRYKKAKRSIVDLYRLAIQNDFRFYSFGDVMLII